MRQPQQKNRSRGRGRKQQNPLSRNFESNGPDVKIRGNAGHIAEKYSTLARDALSNGDTVMAENYYQHAEHYNRIVASAQSQQAARQEENQNANGNGRDNQVQPENNSGATENTEVAGDTQNTDVAANANGSAVEEISEKPPKPVRQTSRRKPRAEAAAPVDEDEPVTASDNATSDSGSTDEEVIAANISDDASKLPGSITGSLAAEEG